MRISSEFDSGNIDILNVISPTNIQLKLKGDNNACTRQWFHFCLDTCAHEVHKKTIVNAGESSFSNANFQTLYHYDNYQSVSSAGCCGSTCNQKHELAKATDYVEHNFGCLSLLLELPFKTQLGVTAKSVSDPQQRCIALGQSILNPIAHYIISIARF